MPSPRGNNSLSSYAIFTQRKLYKEDAYPIGEDFATPIDIWYNKLLYGRVDPSHTPILARPSKVKRVESGDGDIFVLDFVADAFQDFRRHYLFLNKEDAEDNVFTRMRPVAGWTNPLESRDAYLSQLYNMFVEAYLPQKQRYQKIVSFKTFLKEFLKFMKESGKRFPITLTNYLISNFSNPLVSGIMLEIDEVNNGDDATKFREYLTNVCFPCYSMTAQKFGFKIDKNAPWRLIADLKSPAMRCYMTQPPTTFQDLFQEFYEPTYLSDIQMVREVCMTFYNSYVSDHPTYTKYQYSNFCGKTIKKVFHRPLIYRNQINREYSDSFWISYYIKILMYETGRKASKEELKILASRASTAAKRVNLMVASRIIFLDFKKSILVSSKKDA